ncbi:MAG: chemotaxis protein CheB [Herpetosiphon sp.]
MMSQEKHREPLLREALNAKSEHDTGTGHPLAFPIVGVGASAGGLTALGAFFAQVPRDSGMAFVVIVHLSPEHTSDLAAILQRSTILPVQQVTEGTPLIADQVYVIPPARHLMIQDTMLHLVDPEPGLGRYVPIDHFFRTLAESHRSRAAAIVLSGDGADGSLGIKRIKEFGGVVLAQDPTEAEHDSMPRTAIATGMVDFTVPVAAMADVLRSYWQRAAIDTATADADRVLGMIFDVLREATGHDFSQYKPGTVLRRIDRRRQITAAADLTDYLAVLRARPEEVRSLLQDLLISVTNFFRDTPVWTALEGMIPQLFANKTGREQVRVWVAGCATGEEAYSVAMLLQEHAATLANPPAMQVFATDIDDDALATARQGRYLDTIAADVSSQRLGQFFTLEDSRYRIAQTLRDRVIFATHNLLHDAPFLQMDLVCCRNLFIYLNHDAQDHALQLFHFSLRPDGYLLLGTSESPDGVSHLFTVVDQVPRLFKCHALMQPAPVVARQPFKPRHLTVKADAARGPHNRPVSTTAELHQQLLKEAATPSVLVNSQYDIVHLSAGTNRFLQIGAGEATLNLLKVVVPDLAFELHMLLAAATREGSRMEARGVRIALEGTPRLVNLVVLPAHDPAWAGYLLVVFNDTADTGPGARDDAETPPANAGPLVSQLEAEVQRVREQLRATVADFETNVEEHKAANEELLAMNEELRATSEELETSREELQAVNEELNTVNEELTYKVEEANNANSDLQNLLASTAIGTLFLDPALCIKRYTASVRTLFNLIPADIQRPLAHVTHMLRYDELAADAARVLATTEALERQVQSTQGRWYLVRMLPYRKLDDQIDGVVVTFVDVTTQKQVELALRERDEQLALAQRTASIGLWYLDLALGTFVPSEVWCDIMGVQTDTQAAENPGWLGHIHPADLPGVKAAGEAAIRATGELEVEFRIAHPERGERWILSRGRYLPASDSTGPRLLGIVIDVTELKWAEEESRRAQEIAEQANSAKSAFLSRMSHELRTPLNAILGFAQVLEMNNPSPEDRESVEHILRAGRHLLDLINEVLDLTRVDSGTFDLHPESLSVPRVLQSALHLVQPLAVQAGVRLELTPGALSCTVLGDRRRLMQVLLNLLGNAIKYNRPGGQVLLGYRTPTDDCVRIIVTDTGPGLSTDDVQKLFRPFERLHAADTFIEGTGLGLAIAQGLTEAMGGTIGVESVVGQGSTFWVELPCTAISAADPAQAPEMDAAAGDREVQAVSASRRRTVLYIEDNASNARLVERFLKQKPTVRLVVAPTGKRGLDVARSEQPDVILLDLQLPDLDGETVLSQLQADPLTQRIPVVVVSGDAMPNVVTRLLSAGAKNYLTKPLDLQQFLSAIEACIR